MIPAILFLELVQTAAVVGVLVLTVTAARRLRGTLKPKSGRGGDS